MAKDNKDSLSVTLATFNEEEMLPRCLESVKDIADEIIVVDGSSTDKTREIAKKYGAFVVKTINPPIFHINKQKANDLAKSKWILQMDADEALTYELREEIEGLLAGSHPGFDSWISPLKHTVNQIIPIFREPERLKSPAVAYWLPRKNYFLKGYLKHTGQYPDPVIRLFQRGKAHLPAKDVHEQMVVDGKIGWLKGDLDHFATPKFSRYLMREERYSTLLADELKAKHVRISPANSLNYLFLKPLFTFVKLFFRYRGFLDGVPGFIFSLYSGFHFAFGYMKLWELYKKEESKKE